MRVERPAPRAPLASAAPCAALHGAPEGVRISTGSMASGYVRRTPCGGAAPAGPPMRKGGASEPLHPARNATRSRLAHRGRRRPRREPDPLRRGDPESKNSAGRNGPSTRVHRSRHTRHRLTPFLAEVLTRHFLHWHVAPRAMAWQDARAPMPKGRACSENAV